MGVWKPGKADKANRDVDVEVETFWDWGWVEVGGIERAGGVGLGCIPGYELAWTCEAGSGGTDMVVVAVVVMLMMLVVGMYYYGIQPFVVYSLDAYLLRTFCFRSWGK